MVFKLVKTFFIRGVPDMKFKVGELTFIRKVLKPAEDVVSVTAVSFFYDYCYLCIIACKESHKNVVFTLNAIIYFIPHSFLFISLRKDVIVSSR